MWICILERKKKRKKDGPGRRGLNQLTLGGEKNRQAASRIAEWLTVAWNGQAHDACAFVPRLACPRTAMPSAVNVASEMTSF